MDTFYQKPIIILQQHRGENPVATLHVLFEEFDFNRPTQILLGNGEHFERVVRKNKRGKP